MEFSYSRFRAVIILREVSYKIMLFQRRLPFQGLGNQGWQNLGLAAVLTLYCAHIGMEVVKGLALRTDYLAFWSAGYIANNYGYAQVYDLDVMTDTQEQLLAQFGFQVAAFYPTPFLYLPVFILPFQLLAQFPISPSFLLWTAFNLTAFVAYMNLFIRRLGPNTPAQANRLTFMLLVSYPVFSTFHSGQTNIFLLLCAGEFILAIRKGNDFRAGLWLGGLLLKPQTLILIVPALALQRRWKSLTGLSAAILLILLLSTGLAGQTGMDAMATAWGNDAEISPIDPKLMMNWRMVGSHLQDLFGPASPTIAWLGMGVTIIISLLLWKQPLPAAPPAFLMAVFGSLAATCAVTWHSHIYMLAILAPFVAYFYLEGELGESFLNLWTFLLPTALLISLIVSLLKSFYPLPLNEHLTGALLGYCALFLNTYILLLAYRGIPKILSISKR